MQMKCLAIDDEPLALDIIKSYVEKISFLSLAGAFRSGLDAIDVINSGKIDLVFLDKRLFGYCPSFLKDRRKGTK